MWYGWTGIGLEVDLSRGRVKKSEGDPGLYQNYLGAHALITRLFWDKVPPQPEEGPFSANNMLIFGAGPLVGTVAPTACRTTVITRSALTGYLSTSSMAGFWAPEMKFAGYDWVGVSGKSNSPVYIFINNDKVEIRDATHLWGKNVFETQRLIREELGDDNVQSLCIGPAGESRVRYASLEHGPGCSMSRAGAGAVMGDKKLKAIAIRGTRDVSLAQPAPFLELCNDIMRQSTFIDAKECLRWPDPVRGTFFLNIPLNMGNKLYRNFELKRPWQDAKNEYLDLLVDWKAAMVGCFNCQTPCIHAFHLGEQEPVFWKCHSMHLFLAAGDIQDFTFNLRCFAQAQRYGLDGDSAANVCRFAIDLYQKGIITKEDTGGQALEWSNPEIVPVLLEKIVYRQDIGDVLADGAYQAASRIGRGAEQHAYHLRGMEIGGNNDDPKMDGIKSVVWDLIHDRQASGRWWDNWAGYRELLQGLKDPEEIRRWERHLRALSTRRGEARDVAREMAEVDGELMGKSLAYDAESGIIQDGAGICRNRFKKDDNLKKTNGVDFDMKLMSYATGLDLTEEEARKGARRARAITRAYNAILGERMRAGDLPDRLMPDYLLADNRAFLARIMAEANRAMGYNAEGIPTVEHLEELGLGDVAIEMERRGILPPPVSVSITR